MRVRLRERRTANLPEATQLPVTEMLTRWRRDNIGFVLVTPWKQQSTKRYTGSKALARANQQLETQQTQEPPELYAPCSGQVPPAKPQSFEGKPIPEGTTERQVVGRVQRADLTAAPKAVGKLPLLQASLEIMIETDLAELKENPRLPPANQLSVNRLFGHLDEAFKRLDFAIEWGWAKMDIKCDDCRMTLKQATARSWCASKTVPELKRRFARFGYHEKSITQASYFHLEEREQEFKEGEEEVSEDNPRREQNRIRQTRWRASLSEEKRMEIQRRDRERKRQQKILSKIRTGVTEFERNKTPLPRENHSFDIS
jgi:hypothetical protein